MPGQIDITAPATLSVLAGSASPSSLIDLPPPPSLAEIGGSGTLSVTLTAGNSQAVLAVAGAAGVTLAGGGDALTLSGTVLELNAALTGLTLAEPLGATSDLLTLTASDGALATAATFAVKAISTLGPAFVAPPTLVPVMAGTVALVPGLLIADPIASGLAAMGLGREETLSLTLSVTSGVLLLPGLGAQSGVAATGVGSPQIELTFTANELAEVNSLLTGLAVTGVTQWGENLYYTLWNLSGPLPQSVTSGNLFLYSPHTLASTGTLALGGETVISGPTSLTTPLTGFTELIGPAAGALTLAPSANLLVPEAGLTLSGTSMVRGQLSAASLSVTGTVFTASAPVIAGHLALAPNAVLTFANGLSAAASIATDYAEGISLGTGAVLAGAGQLSVGYFSESGLITGAGTILAPSGDTLTLAAGAVTGGVDLAVQGGGAMVLGPLAQLYGVFLNTPLTIASDVTLSFLTAAAQPLTGGYAGTLGGQGGAFIISGAQNFAGTIAGFQAGDELVFPGLTGVSVYNVTANGFAVAGIDQYGSTQSFTFAAAIPASLAVAAGLDTQGDPAIYLRAASAQLSQAAPLADSAGTPQLLAGLALALGAPTTNALSLTLAVGHGGLAVGGASFAPTITLTGASLSALNAELAALSYLGTGLADQLTLTATTGIPGGLSETISISPAAAGAAAFTPGAAFSAAELVSFTGTTSAIGQPLAVGGLAVTGTADFSAPISAAGYGGTALLVDAGGDALFGPAASAWLTGNVTLGDTAGPGQLDIWGASLSVTGTLGESAGSAAFITGAATFAGAIDLQGGANLNLAGSLAAATATLDAGATLLAFGGAALSLGTLANSGAITLANAATAALTAYAGAGTLALGGQASLGVTGTLALTGGLLALGPGATLMAAGLNTAAGLVQAAGLIAAGASATLGAVSLTGGTLAAATLTEAGTLTGQGVIKDTSLTLTGGLEAVGGQLLVGGALSAPGSLVVASTGTLELAGAASGAGGIGFAGGNALLILDDPTQASLPVSGMAGGDAIDLVGINPSHVAYAGGMVEIGGVAAFSLALGGGTLTTLADQAGGALLTVNGQLPCFARGTPILTPHGYRPVESFSPGDPVVTAFGQTRPVRWLGWRTLDLAGATGHEAWPVLIAPHAFGPGRPARALRLSPNHCLFLEGVLIPVTALVNGVTITRERGAKAASYYHLELDRHDILLADGLACESYLDTGNRAALYTGRGRHSPARRPFAPIVTSGLKLTRARQALARVAEAQGFTRTYQPRLKAFSGGITAWPEFTQANTQRLARFRFPRPVRRLILLAPTAAPAETAPTSDDWRELSVCLAPTPGLRLGTGWHPPAIGDTGTWMGARAELSLTQARAEITLTLAAIAQYWARFPTPP